MCSCRIGYRGDPLNYCERSGECSDHTGCAGHLACRNGNCVDPCAGTCGVNSNCQVKNTLKMVQSFFVVVAMLVEEF